MGERRWRTLTGTARDPRTKAWRSGSARSNRELRAAEIAGEAVGREHGMVYTAPSPADVARFLEGYDAFAERSARLLRRFGIDGMTTFRHARDVVRTRRSRQDRMRWRGNMSGALDGICVVDFSHVMAGPYASHLLRLLGAEVIKIEAPGIGDAMRNYGPDRRYDGMAPAFIAVNAGKKSLVLNLKHPPAREAARRLIARADVVLENFRPGVMARLGLDYEACARCSRAWSTARCPVMGSTARGATGPPSTTSCRRPAA